MTRELATKQSRGCSIAAMALFFLLAACNHPGESAGSPPSAGSFHIEPLEVHTGDTTEKVNGAAVTSAFFRETKSLPLLGRQFLDQEYQASSARVVVMASSLWQRRFGGDPGVIGRTLQINERPYTIVGILPQTFQYPAGVELWLPQNQ
jgi:hypothetical protein